MLATKKKVSTTSASLSKAARTAKKAATPAARAAKPKISVATAKAGRLIKAAKPSKSDKTSAGKKSADKKGAAGEREDRDKARLLALGVAGVGLEHSALNVEIIDVRGKVDYADYVVVMSGRSDRQVSALARHIETDLEKKHGERCIGVEGLPTASWLLMDYGDVVVHIFHEDTRGYYDLETLWLDAARVPTPPERSSQD